MLKVAFICPIYDSRNHFSYGLSLLKSKIRNNITADLFYIFSNDQQRLKFEVLAAEEELSSDFNYLVLPENEGKYKSQVTIKKIYGLIKLKDRYDYLAAIDSEAIFIKHIEYDIVFETMWNNNDMLKANKSPNGYFIMKKCFNTLGIYNNEILKRETNNYLYNVWFNDIPLYKCNLINEFLDWLATLNQNYKNEWMCFEYYIFMAFLVIKKGYHLSKYPLESLGGVIEYLYVFPVWKQKEIIQMLGTHWTSSDKCITGDTGIRFHLDRDEESEAYNSKSFFKELKRFKRARYKNIIKERLGINK